MILTENEMAKIQLLSLVLMFHIALDRCTYSKLRELLNVVHCSRGSNILTVHGPGRELSYRHEAKFSLGPLSQEIVMRLRGAGRPITSTIGKVRSQEIKLKKIRKAHKSKSRYKAGTLGFLPFVGPHLYALGGRSSQFELRSVTCSNTFCRPAFS
jgi:hypothetical protein